MKQVQEDSGGKVRMGAGTLYGSLKRMMEARLVEECGKRSDAEIGAERRIYYRLAGLGQTALTKAIGGFERTVGCH